MLVMVSMMLVMTVLVTLMLIPAVHQDFKAKPG
jgi:hypothetical protein